MGLELLAVADGGKQLKIPVNASSKRRDQLGMYCMIYWDIKKTEWQDSDTRTEASNNQIAQENKMTDQTWWHDEECVNERNTDSVEKPK